MHASHLETAAQALSHTQVRTPKRPKTGTSGPESQPPHYEHIESFSLLGKHTKSNCHATKKHPSGPGRYVDTSTSMTYKGAVGN